MNVPFKSQFQETRPFGSMKNLLSVPTKGEPEARITFKRHFFFRVFNLFWQLILNLPLCFSSYCSQVLKSRLQHPRCEQRVPVLEMPPSPNYLARLPAISPQHPLASNHPLARWALPFLTLRGHQVQSLPPHQPHPHHHPHPHPPPPPPHAQFPAHPHPAQPAIFPHPGLYPHHAMLPPTVRSAGDRARAKRQSCSR